MGLLRRFPYTSVAFALAVVVLVLGVPRRQPRPGEPVWDVRVDHVTWSCKFRFHGEPYGWEAQILREDELVIGAPCRQEVFAARTPWARPGSSQRDLQQRELLGTSVCPASPSALTSRSNL